MQDAEGEGQRFAAAGVGLGDQVAALQDQRQALGLDGRHVDVAEALEVAQQRRRQWQGGEVSGGHGKRRWNGTGV